MSCQLRSALRRACVGLAAGAVFAGGGVAYARECDDGAFAADQPPPAVLIVMDASRSMGKPVGGGGTRLAAAKAALRTVVDGLPERARVGLRLYGHRVSGAGRAAGCRDTELVAPVGALGREALTARIDSYHAVGSTPIGHALRLARPTFRPVRQARSCSCPTAATTAPLRNPARSPASWPPPGPASASRRSASRSGPARRQLRCIARRGRGVYRDAADADELAVALRALAARSVRTYTPVGARIRGGATQAAAAALSGGRFVDRIGADEDRWYAVRLQSAQRLAVAAVVSHACPFPRGLAEMTGTSLELTLFDPSGELPEASSGVANLFVGDESSESDGLLTDPIGARVDPSVKPTRPGRYLLRVRLSDNGNGVLADVLDGGSLPLAVHANITGGRRTCRPPAIARRRARLRAARP